MVDQPSSKRPAQVWQRSVEILTRVIFALLVPIFILVLGTYFGNGVPDQTTGVDPRNNPPFGWDGLGNALHTIALYGWGYGLPIALFLLLFLHGASGSYWSEMTQRKKVWWLITLFGTLLGCATLATLWLRIMDWLLD
jgi:hypothetical protein